MINRNYIPKKTPRVALTFSRGCSQCGADLPQGTPPYSNDPIKGEIYLCEKCKNEGTING